MTALHARARRVHLRPTTHLGHLSCWLGLAFLGWFVLNQTLVVTVGGGSVAPPPTLRALIIAFGLSGLAIGLAAGIVGAIAITRRHERSPLVFAAILPGLFVVVLLVGELLFPH